jgi:hypothetical protein
MTATRSAGSTALLFLISILIVDSHAAVSAAADAIRITAAANVALRQSPNTNASTVAFVPLGTELADVGPAGLDKTWVRVRVPDNREGWVLSSLTRTFVPATRWQTIEGIVTDRLTRQGDAFTARVELADFVERVSHETGTPERSARFALFRLRAVANAAAAVPFKRQDLEPYRSWLDRNSSLLVYDEPGGRWMLTQEAIWDVHARDVTVPAADEIAWLAATTGLPGECEGEVTCYVDSTDQLSGHYLRAHPLGRHAADAVQRIGAVADHIAARPTDQHALYAFNPAHDCATLTKSLDALRAAVTSTTAPGRDATLQSLGALRGMCKGH